MIDYCMLLMYVRFFKWKFDCKKNVCYSGYFYVAYDCCHFATISNLPLFKFFFSFFLSNNNQQLMLIGLRLLSFDCSRRPSTGI